MIYIVKLFILFFFLIYICCECTKYNRIEGVKKKSSGKVYNLPVVYIKLISIVITIVLTIVNRFTSGGKLENSGGIKGILIVGVLYAIFLFFSIWDIKKARVQTVIEEEDSEVNED